MKIAIISDVHDNLVNLEKCLKWCRENKVEKIICCGDIANGETLKFLAEFPFLYKDGGRRRPAGEIFLVRGNMEIYSESELAAYPNVVNGGRTAVWEIGKKIIGACHEPFLIRKVFALSAEAARRRAKYSPPREGLGEGRESGIDIIFYGHTHKPWVEEKGGTILVNPGTLGGVFSRATFAVYDTEKIEPELKILDLL